MHLEPNEFHHRRFTEADFTQLSWHDCALSGVSWSVGDFGAADLTSDLGFELDYITEWICEVDGSCQFKIAPARLVFHGVTDPRMTFDWGKSGFQVAIYDAVIDRIERQQVAEQKIFLETPYYEWRVLLHLPIRGEISFGAVGFTMTLLAEPILKKGQGLSRAERATLLRATKHPE